MKNKFLLLLTLCAVVLITNSCKKEDNVILSVTVDGTAYKIGSTSITDNTTVSGGNTYYTFTVTLNNIPLYLYLPSIKTGTYPFESSFNPGTGMLLSGANGETYTTVKNGIPSKGNIIITASTSSTITGTFYGVTYPQPVSNITYTDSTTISQGVFTNMQY